MKNVFGLLILIKYNFFKNIIIFLPIYFTILLPIFPNAIIRKFQVSPESADPALQPNLSGSKIAGKSGFRAQ